MKLIIPYAGGSFELDAESFNLELPTAREPAAADGAETIARALSSPMSAPSLREFLEGADDAVIIVNDAKRATPTALVLDLLGAELGAVSDLTFAVATGTHRAPTRDEMRTILGQAAEQRARRTVVHDSRDAGAMRRLGTTPRGTDVSVSRLVTDASRIVVIGSVEPHYFAGFTGGRKAILPGVAAYETIRQNHSHATDPGARLMALKGNPVHEDMMDALELMGDRRIFAVMVVLDGAHSVRGAFAGDIRATFDAAAERARDVYSVPVSGKADVVVAVAQSPADSDLYQAHKAIESARLALADGGILILVAACPEGVGSDAFVAQLSASPRPEDVARSLGPEYSLGDHKAVKLAELVQRADVWAVTDLPDSVVEDIFFRPWHDLGEALDEALRRKGPDARVLVLMNAAVNVPRMP